MRKFKIFSFIYSIGIVFFSELSFAAVGGNELEQSQQNTSLILSFFSTELLLNLVFAVIVVIATLALSKIVSAKVTNYIEGLADGEEANREELAGVLSRTAHITILAIGFSITLTILGVDMGIFLGGLGFGIGFTLKIFLSNFISGIIMVTQGTYHNGDVVDVGGKVGTIRKIHSLFTAIEQFDGVIYYVPNIKFLEENVSNYHTNSKRRVDVEVGVDYNTDIVKAKKIIMQVLDQFPNILKAPNASIYVTELGDNSISLSVRFWIDSKDAYFAMKSNVIETINMAFRQSGIEIPFPQVTLSNRGDFKLQIEK